MSPLGAEAAQFSARYRVIHCMRNAWLIIAFAASSACQPRTKLTAAKRMAEPERKHSASFDTAGLFSDTSARGTSRPDKENATAASERPIPVRFGKVLRNDLRSQLVVDSAKIRSFFTVHSMAPLIQTVKGGQGDYAMNGFRGADHYRTEAAMTSARQNPQNPLAYSVHGLTRTKRHVRRFQGEIVFDSLFVEPMLTVQDKKDIDNWAMMLIISLDNDKTVGRYAVAGSVRLSENKASPQAAYFQGRVVLELALTRKGRIHINAPFLHGPSQGGGQKYAGNWTSYQTGQTTPTVWVKSITGYGPFVYSDFIIGERDVEINPKYAKQGWNAIWENDEWWAKTPKPSLNL